jgi:hypothetical protein
LRAICCRRGSQQLILAELNTREAMERVMSETEFDRVMDAVRTAIVLVPIEDSLARSLVAVGPPKATNDNIGAPWPIIPFPDGSCVS